MTEKKRPYDPFIFPLETIATKPTDEPLTCLAINENWIPLLLGAMRALETDFMWAGDQATQDAMIVKASYFPLTIKVCEMPTYLRQSEDNPCQLEYSFDEETWYLAFDYALCQNETFIEHGIGESDLAEIQRKIDLLLDRYDGSPESVVDNTIDDDEYFNAALCLAIDLLIRGMAQLLIKQKQDKERGLINRLFEGLSAPYIAVFVLLGIPALWAGILVGAYLIVAKEWVLSTIDDITIEELRDEDALREVVCMVYAALYDGLLPSTSNFVAAFNPTGLGTDTAEYFIMNTMYLMAQTGTDMYVGFLDYIDSAYEISEDGLLADNCVDCVMTCTSTDFEVEEGLWTSDIGTWSSGEGYVNTPTSPYVQASCKINFTTPQTIREVHAVYSALCADGNPSRIGIRATTLPDLGGSNVFDIAEYIEETKDHAVYSVVGEYANVRCVSIYCRDVPPCYPRVNGVEICTD